MDSLYLTGLPDSLSLQEMLDCDIKTEMDVDDCFSLGELPPLALEDSLDAKWELIDPASNNGLLFSRATPLHSPGSDMTMWFNAGGSGVSGMVGNSSLDIDPTAMMVNPSSVMPLTLVSTPAPVISRPAPTPVVNTQPASVVSTHVVSHSVQTQPITTHRPKISRPSSINIVCSQNSPFTIVRTTSISSATTSTLAQADSNNGVVRSPAVVRSKPQPVQQASLNDIESKAYPKPAYSYSCLIALALKNSSSGSLPVSEIYNFMCEHFPYFKTAPNGWKNSVRHNLSLNKCFEKIEKPTGNGSQRKGCLWAMNPAKTTKMDDEVQKWSRKDPIAIRRAMVIPDNLEMLERGEMKRELPSSSTHSGDDYESEEGTEEEEVPTTPPVSPPQEQPFTPPHVAVRRGMGESDPIGHDDTEEEDEDFVDIGALDQLGDQSLSEFDLDVNEGLYEELGEERLNLGVNISASGAKIQGNYLCKQQSYVCKPTSTSTTVRIRKVQPAILLTNNKRQHI